MIELSMEYSTYLQCNRSGIGFVDIGLSQTIVDTGKPDQLIPREDIR